MKLDSSIAAVVTGGASGLGEATARALAAKGARVAIFDMQKDKGEALASEIGGVFCEVNVTSDDSVQAAFAKARAAHGQERVLVNCAGIANAIKTVSRSREDGSLTGFPMDQYIRVIEVNLIGTFRCILSAAMGMVEAEPLADGERGVIVNTASVAAVEGQMGQAAYSASKGGVLGMTLPVARDLMNEGVRVNTILPGIFATPMMLSLPEKAQVALAASVPFPKRLGDPAEYAHIVVTMVENGYLNGEAVRLDGALRMGPK
jgi:NAD(P)-dependent dehydrogenase (short-subunit alcohol dehydrogenase family)